MCGIVGIIGRRDAAPLIVDALKRLEYRGYDSAGVATIDGGEIHRRRASGKLVNLEAKLSERPLPGAIGIGHTRWATHGAPTEENAHPHFIEGVAVVHNGIIENFAELRAELEAGGAVFQSQTDTETVAQLAAKLRKDGLSPRDAALRTIDRLRGAYALVLMFEDEPETLIGACNGPPLAIGHGDGEMFFGSDAIALSPFTDRVTYLHDGDTAIMRRTEVEVLGADRRPVHREIQQSAVARMMVDRGNHKHFMEKEIHEQPEVVSHTLTRYVDLGQGRIRDTPIDFARLGHLYMSACGTASLAAMVGKYWFESIARLPAEVDVASEFRYREPPLRPDALALFISQSGETADTLASLRYCRDQGIPTATLVNVTESTMARDADTVLPTLAGVEIGVASTKAFTCQLTVLACLAGAAAKARGYMDAEAEAGFVRSLAELPRLMTEAVHMSDAMEAEARRLSHSRSALYLGRGTAYPMALEGALKLKEISYIHAEGYAAGELKHGPIALIDEDMPVIVVAPHDRLFEKTVSNMQEVAARGGRIILITDQAGEGEVSLETEATIVMPDCDPVLAPILYSVPLQLLAYYTAVHMGTDVDQPRNLAKSVTVE